MVPVKYPPEDIN